MIRGKLAAERGNLNTHAHSHVFPLIVETFFARKKYDEGEIRCGDRKSQHLHSHSQLSSDRGDYFLTHHDSSTIKIARLSPSPTPLPTSPQTSNIEHRTSNIEHPTSNFQRLRCSFELRQTLDLQVTKHHPTYILVSTQTFHFSPSFPCLLLCRVCILLITTPTL